MRDRFLANIFFRCKTLAGTQYMMELRMTHRKTSLEHKVAVHIASNILPNLSIQKLQLDQAFTLRYDRTELLRTASIRTG